MTRYELPDVNGAPIDVHDDVGEPIGTVMPIRSTDRVYWIYRTPGGFQSSFTHPTQAEAEAALRYLARSRRRYDV